MANEEAISTGEIAKVEVRLPTFSSSDPELFFARAESSFAAAGVTSDYTKYFHASQALDDRAANVVRDVLMKPPDQNRYATLREELIKRLARSQEEKLRQLLESEELGDRKPSEFLRHLRELAAGKASEEILRMLWLARLPHSTQVALATQIDSTLDNLARLADAVASLIPNPPALSQVNSRSLDELLEEKIARLGETLERKLMTATQSRRDTYGNGNRQYRSSDNATYRRNRSKSRNRRDNTPQDGKCFFHARFGAAARKCRAPCNWTGNAPAGF
jgi:hypothetical protein